VLRDLFNGRRPVDPLDPQALSDLLFIVHVSSLLSSKGYMRIDDRVDKFLLFLIAKAWWNYRPADGFVSVLFIEIWRVVAILDSVLTIPPV
jgi:hypothetical protein